MEEVGSIKVSRDIKNQWLWKDAEKLKWWLDILTMATPQRTQVLEGQKLVTLERGQLVASLLFLVKKWKRPRTTIDYFLKSLIDREMITRVTSNNVTIITVLDYENVVGEAKNEVGHLIDCKSDSYSTPIGHPIGHLSNCESDSYNTPFVHLANLHPGNTEKPIVHFSNCESISYSGCVGHLIGHLVGHLVGHLSVHLSDYESMSYSEGVGHLIGHLIGHLSELQEKQEKERSKEKEVKEEEKSLLLFNNNNKEKKEVVVVDVEKEKKNKEFFKVDKNEVEDYLAKYCREHQIGLEAWLQKNKLDDVEDFKNYARQVFTEWELTHESEHEDEKSLLRHLFNQIRIKIKSEKQERHENNSGSAWQNFQQRWARPKPAYGLIE